jgi:hypothetical protein
MAELQTTAESIVDDFLNPENNDSNDSDAALRVVDEFLTGQSGGASEQEFILGEKLGGGIRAGLAFWGDTLAEKYRHFKKSYPQGEIARNPDDGELYYRKTPEGPFNKIDPNMFTDPGGWSDLPSDVLEFGAQEGLTLLGETLAFAALRRPPLAAADRVRTLLGRVLRGIRTRPSALGEEAGWLEHTGRAGLGAGAGEVSRQLAQTLGGTQQETTGQQLGRAGEMAAYAGLGELATKPIIKGIGAIRGIPLARLREGVDPALRAAKRFRLPHLTPGQTVVNPILTRLERMGRTMSTKMITHFEDQIKSARKAWSSLVNSGANQNTITANIKRAVDDAESAIYRQANVRWKSLDSARTGEAIMAGVMKWDELAKKSITRLYNRARSAETPTYDISNLKTVADDVVEGVRYSAPSETVGTGLIDAAGVPITREVPRDRRLGQQLNQAVREVVETVRDLNPDLPSVTHAGGRIDDATEQLKELRRELWDIKTPAPGDVRRQEHRDAARLYDAISKVMNNPVLDTEDGARLWHEAAGAASDRFMKLDKAILMQVLKTDVRGGASDLARSVIARGNQSDLEDLKDVLPGIRFMDISNFAAREIFDNPALLKTMDKDVLKTLFRQPDLDNIRGIVDDFERIRTVGADLSKRFADNTNQRKGLTQFLLGATPRQTEDFIETISSHPESIDLIRQTVLDGMAESAIVRDSFDPATFLSIYDKMNDSGLFREGALWTGDQLQNIKDLSRYIEVSSGLSKSQIQDAGTSLMAAEAVSPTAVATQGLSALPVMLHKVLLVGGFGKLLTSRAFSRIIRGRHRRSPGPGQARWDSDLLRGISAALAASIGRSSEEETE